MGKGILLAIALIGIFFVNFAHGALTVGFYKGKCNGSDVEAIVRGVIETAIKKDPTVVAALLRMQFHDCFVNGCDASLLLDGTSSEKTAIPNRSVRGYEVIDAAKAAVERKCPGVVSCADIIVLATRDSVSFSKGGIYNVETGRRDGSISLASNVNLPGPSISVSSSIQLFNSKGLSSIDMVYLLGGHTVGIAHCALFQPRLWNFRNTGRPDPSMDLQLLKNLRIKCPNNTNSNNFADLDQGFRSALAVDKSYFEQILFMKRGILEIDQALASDQRTRGTVAKAASGFDFNAKFGDAMVKLGRVGVLTDTKGEIRKSCRAVNKKLIPRILP